MSSKGVPRMDQYRLDPQLGWMNAPTQTWFPFSIPICLNGREWLARQMAQAGSDYHLKSLNAKAV